MVRGSFFSLGAWLSRVWHTRSPMTPFVCVSSVLTAGAIWDKVRTGGPIDFILLGLAGYELVIGLTEEQAVTPAVEQVDRQGGQASPRSH